MRKYLLLFALLLSAASLRARTDGAETLPADTLSLSQLLTVPADTLLGYKTGRNGRFLPMRRRIDREIGKNKFVYKGEVAMGFTASYGTLSSDDTDFLLVLEHIDADGTVATVKPFFGYAYRDNQMLGVRFGYRHISATLNNLGFNLGEQNDLSGSLGDMDLTSDNFTFSFFHRSYHFEGHY